MADLTITAANVVPGADSRSVRGVAGETLTAGQVVYKDATSGKWLKADCDSATAAAKAPSGVALTGSSLNQPVVVHQSGDLTVGATVTAGVAYYLSGTAGGICPYDDLASGDNVVLIGIAKSASVLAVNIQVPGVTL